MKVTLNLKYIIKCILAIALFVLTLFAYLINRIFALKVNFSFTETETDTNVKLEATFLFRRSDLVLSLTLDSPELAQIDGIGRNIKLVEEIIPYNKINDTDFMINLIFNACQPIFDAIQRQIGNQIDIDNVKRNFRQQITIFIKNNKQVLNTLTQLTTLLAKIIFGIFIFYVISCIYILIPFKLRLVSFIMALITLILTLVFNVIVFIIPGKVNGIQKNVSVEIDKTLILLLASSYTICLIYIIQLFMKKRTWKI